MAIVLKFRRNTTDMSFQDGSAGAQLMPGWAPAVARPRYGRAAELVAESMPIRISDTSHDNLAAELQELHQMQMWAEEHQVDRNCEYPVWLHAKLNGETGERRAWAKRITADLKSGWYDPTVVANHQDMQLTVERAPYWEELTTNTGEVVEPTAAVAFVNGYSTGASTPAGDAPARVQSLSMDPLGAGDELGRVWIGVRSTAKHGTLSNFIPIWQCEDTDATLGTNAANDIHDATASPGGAGHTCVRITPGTATWAKRLTIQLGDVTANYSDNFGHFLWLLRAKLSAAETWEVQLRFGYTDMADADHLQGPVVEVASTSWNIYEAGQSWIPLRDLRQFGTASYGSLYDASFQVQVWARRTSGSGTIDLDCLCPIPIDESWLIMKGVTAAVGDSIKYCSDPAGRFGALVSRDAGGGVLTFVDVPQISASPGGLLLPPGLGTYVICYARETTSDITDTMQYVTEWYDRWLTLRGAE